VKVFLTAVGSALGTELGKALLARGHTVVGTSRAARAEIPGVQQVPWSLAEAANPSWFEDVDAVVHLAWDVRPGGGQISVEGTCALAQMTRRCGVPNQLFVSSVSAQPHALSEYGRSKFACEQRLGTDLCIVRPGLVISSDGLFGRMAAVLRKTPLIPLLDGGANAVQLIGMTDLMRILVSMVEEPVRGAHSLFYHRTDSMRTLLSDLAAVLDRRVWQLSVPSGPLLVMARGLERLGMRSPITSEQILGYRANTIMLHRPSAEWAPVLHTDLKSLIRTELFALSKGETTSPVG
jgi:nucleoside-diphosphate-sugar epimerase